MHSTPYMFARIFKESYRQRHFSTFVLCFQFCNKEYKNVQINKLNFDKEQGYPWPKWDPKQVFTWAYPSQKPPKTFPKMRNKQAWMHMQTKVLISPVHI